MSAVPEVITAQNFINGEFRESVTGERAENRSPVTGRLLGSYSLSSVSDVDTAVAAARAAQRSWAALSVFQRVDALNRVADNIRSRREELARLLTLEQGKVYATEALGEVDEMLDGFTVSLEAAKALEGSMPASFDPNKRVLVYRVPRGVAVSIQPWNYPLVMMGANLIPALVTGNTVLSVPAPSTALVASEMTRCFAEADLPAGVFNFVTGLGNVVGAAAAGHPGVDAVGFTGSTATGAAVASAAAGKAQLLELGGNGPTVILDDADLDLVVPELLSSSFLVAGQACTGAEWVLVQGGIHDELVKRLTSAVEEQIRLGNPLEPATRMGPLNNAQLVEKVQRHINQAVEGGARICTGGGLRGGMPTDLYFEPTVLAEVKGDMDISREETFGPVIPVQRIADENEALAAIDRSSYGLAAAVFTGDLERGLRFAEAAPTGNVNVNLGSTWTEPHLPFGGGAGKRSGIGRSQGRYPLTDTFTELKTVILQLR